MTWRGIVRGWLGSIGVRLFLWIFGAMAVVFLLVGYVNDRRTSAALERSFEEQSNRMAAAIDRTLRFGMLLEDKEAVHRSLDALALEPGIRVVRIYDKRGEVAFSTDRDEIGLRHGKRDRVCSGCHPSALDPPIDIWSASFREADGVLVHDHIHVVKNEERCAASGCHVSPDRSPVLGTLEVKTSMAPLDRAHSEAQQSIVYGTLLMALAGGLVAGAFIWRFVRHPMKELIAGTRKVAQGDLSTRIHLGHGSGELHELSVAFNRMSEGLTAARARDLAWERELERAIEEKTTELSRIHRRMAQMEKMASLGKLSATVAHEINNPLGGILVYAKLLRRELGDGDEESRHHLDMIAQESSRCGDIVKSLLSFARESAAYFSHHDVNELVRRALATVQHLMASKGADVEFTPLEGDGRVHVDGAQIQQAMIALVVNAVEAMPGGGVIRIEVRSEGDHVRIVVADQGVGIDPELLPHIFEPFVSTKRDKGVGLGLSVVYGIVQRHGGSIEADSVPNRGSTMTVVLPRGLSAADSREETAHGL